MAPGLSGQISIFGVVFFVSKSLLGIKRLKQLKTFTILTPMPQSHFSIFIYCDLRLSYKKRPLN